MKRNSEKIAIIILVPMIIFTLIITLSSKFQTMNNTSPKNTTSQFDSLSL